VINRSPGAIIGFLRTAGYDTEEGTEKTAGHPVSMRGSTIMMTKSSKAPFAWKVDCKLASVHEKRIHDA
jgi:hypothetical protein